MKRDILKGIKYILPLPVSQFFLLSRIFLLLSLWISTALDQAIALIRSNKVPVQMPFPKRCSETLVFELAVTI